MNLLHRAGTFFFCLSCVLPSAFAQQQTASPATPQLMPAPAPNAEGQPLILDVVVTGKSGKAVPGLAEKDFVVRDNGQPQKILSFRAVVGGGTASALPPEEPVKIIMIVDEVNTSFSAVAYERNEIQRVLLQNDGKLSHPVSMAFFSDTKTDIQNGFSQDGRALLAVFDEHMTALRSIRRSTGVYGAEERLQLSLKTLQMLAEKEAQDPGRKMVVWISPGLAAAFRAGHRIDGQATAGSIFLDRLDLDCAPRGPHYAVQYRPAGNERCWKCRLDLLRKFSETGQKIESDPDRRPGSAGACPAEWWPRAQLKQRHSGPDRSLLCRCGRFLHPDRCNSAI